MCGRNLELFLFIFHTKKESFHFVYVYAMDLANTIFILNFDDFNTCMKCYLGKYTDVNQ